MIKLASIKKDPDYFAMLLVSIILFVGGSVHIYSVIVGNLVTSSIEVAILLIVVSCLLLYRTIYFRKW